MSEKQLIVWISCLLGCFVLTILTRLGHPEWTETQLFMQTWWVYALMVGLAVIVSWIVRRYENPR